MFKTLFEFVNKNIISYCFDIKTNSDYDKETESFIDKYNVKILSTSYNKNLNSDYDKENIKISYNFYNKKSKFDYDNKKYDDIDDDDDKKTETFIDKYNENLSTSYNKKSKFDYDNKKYEMDDYKKKTSLSSNNSSCDFNEFNDSKIGLSTNIDTDYDIISDYD